MSVATFIQELEAKVKDLASHLETDGKRELAELEKLYTELRPDLEALVEAITAILGKLTPASTPSTPTA